ncbi:MAG: sel1 repeat family protein, partial [Opitutaceae bacterium]|nr:sel1 repeat family protein [Opitutaceae bacterium]
MKKLPIILSFALIACLSGCKSAATKSLILKAGQGDAAAQYELGVLYYNGQGVMRNFDVAAKWYRKAAEQGHAIAQYNLGRMYEAGWSWVAFLNTYRYQDKDYTEAAKWYRMAAEQGLASAQNNLGLLYEKGKGVGKDNAEAVK